MNKIYEYVKKAISNLRTIIFSVVLLWAIISTIGFYTTKKCLRRTEQRLNDLRTELESAQDRERELTETVDNIKGITERTDQILGQSSDTIQGIRTKIQTLEEYFNNIHQYMCTNDNNHDNNTDSEE